MRHLQPLWGRHRECRLVEPFCGGLAVALGLRPSRALLNDINPHVVNFYRWLQRGLTITRPLANNAATYYRLRAEFNHLLATGRDDSEQAAGLFYYLNRTGYNGLCRFNQQGGFNVPFGRYASITYRRDFSPYVDMLSGISFSCVDFEGSPLEPQDFVYADPPYDVEFRQYSQGGFTWADQVRTAEWLSQHRGPVVLSNQATERIVDLYRALGYDVAFLSGRRLISCTGDRTPAKEVLASRNL